MVQIKALYNNNKTLINCGLIVLIGYFLFKKIRKK